jgi:predicted alpha/beta-hydrolase family hydrolase
MHVTPLFDDSGVPVRGFLHEPDKPCGCSLALTHGAGSDSNTLLLRALADAFTARGWTVLRFDLPYRQQRRHGPPFPAAAGRDREGIRRAVEVLARLGPHRLFLGGHSYGGRQSTMLAAEQPDLVEAMLLLSYPLHPPRKPAQQRTAHLPQLCIPALFVQGSRDPFGSEQEMRSAAGLIPARTEVVVEEGVAHSLSAKPSFAGRVAELFQDFTKRA